MKSSLKRDETLAETPATVTEQAALSHNLLGQRLGRKGRDTRERILAATARLLLGPADNVISLSAVAREASLGMTTCVPETCAFLGVTCGPQGDGCGGIIQCGS